MLIVTELPNRLQDCSTLASGQAATPDGGDEIRGILAREEREPWSGGVEALKPVRERRGPRVQVRVPHGFEWNRYELPIAGLSANLDGFRIIHLTDMHFKPFWSRTYEKLAKRVTEAAADLVLITGDFVDNKIDAAPTLPHVMRFVEGLKGRLGVYAILGNHDGDLVGPYLPKAGLVLVDGRRVEVAPGIELIGTTEVGRDDFDWEQIRGLGPKPAGGVRIIMSHFPDTLKRVGICRPDIMLAGHTHGGQICLPGGRPIIRHDALPRHLCSGVRRVGGTYLVVNRGLGFSSIPVRMWCPAEVIEIVMHRASAP